MTDAYIGEIRPFAGNYAPENWHLCDGTVLPISGNEALFSVLGSQFGGNGQTNFALPDLRGRIIVCQGQGTNLTARTMGQNGGTETVQLLEANWPAHTHSVSAVTDAATTSNINTMMFAAPQLASNLYLKASTPAASMTDAPMAADQLSLAGSGGSHENRMPMVAISYIIAILGNYPSPN